MSGQKYILYIEMLCIEWNFNEAEGFSYYLTRVKKIFFDNKQTRSFVKRYRFVLSRQHTHTLIPTLRLRRPHIIDIAVFIIIYHRFIFIHQVRVYKKLDVKSALSSRNVVDQC